MATTDGPEKESEKERGTLEKKAPGRDPKKLQEAFEKARKALNDLPKDLPADITKMSPEYKRKLKAVVDASLDLDAAQFSKTSPNPNH